MLAAVGADEVSSVFSATHSPYEAKTPPTRSHLSSFILFFALTPSTSRHNPRQQLLLPSLKPSVGVNWATIVPHFSLYRPTSFQSTLYGFLHLHKITPVILPIIAKVLVVILILIFVSFIFVLVPLLIRP